MLNRRFLATSPHPVAKAARALVRGVRTLSIPAPRVIVAPALAVVVAIRNVYHFALRVFVCEPLFKAYCREYGRDLHTDIFLHWVMGDGDIIVGDDVLFDGKISINFAARYCERPTLRVGSHSGIGHAATLTIGKAITIGAHCRIAGDVAIFDVSGHPADPSARLAGEPPSLAEVRPVVIEDNVWIGKSAIIHPGVRIGWGSIVSAGAVVLADVPALSVVAGNPARKIGVLAAPSDTRQIGEAIGVVTP